MTELLIALALIALWTLLVWLILRDRGRVRSQTAYLVNLGGGPVLYTPADALDGLERVPAGRIDPSAPFRGSPLADIPVVTIPPREGDGW